MGRNRLFDPSGKPYNDEDPLGLLEKEFEEKDRKENPDLVQLFIEREAIKKDRARQFRINPPSRYELIFDFKEIIGKIKGMVVIFKKHNRFVKGRVQNIIGEEHLKVLEKGTKLPFYVQFKEVLSLRDNYA